LGIALPATQLRSSCTARPVPGKRQCSSPCSAIPRRSGHACAGSMHSASMATRSACPKWRRRSRRSRRGRARAGGEAARRRRPADAGGFPGGAWSAVVRAAWSGQTKAAVLWELDARPAGASLHRTPPCCNTAGSERCRPPESLVPVAPLGCFAPSMRSCSTLMQPAAVSGSPSSVPTRCGLTQMSHEASSKRFYSRCWDSKTTRVLQPAGKGLLSTPPVFSRRTASKFPIVCRQELRPCKNRFRAAGFARKILSSICFNKLAFPRNRVHYHRKINWLPHLAARTKSIRSWAGLHRPAHETFAGAATQCNNTANTTHLLWPSQSYSSGL